MAVDIGDEMQGKVALAISVKGRHDHLRAEIGAADADVDDVPDAARARVAHALGECEHALEDFMDFFAMQRRLARRTQRDMQDGTVLRRIDRRPGQHRIAPLLDAAFAGQVCQGGHHPLVDQVLGKIGKHAGCLERKRIKAPRIDRERLAQIESRSARFKQGFKDLPRISAVTTRGGNHQALEQCTGNGQA